MRKSIYITSLFVSLFGASALQAQSETSYAVSEAHTEANSHYFVKKIPLKNNASPLVRISNIVTTPTISQNGTWGNSFEPDIAVVTERKQHFAILKFPKFIIKNNQVQQLQSLDVVVTEAEVPAVKQRPTFADNSVLASGDWYKIAIPRRGVYKIDYNFLVQAGVNPAQINPQNIRLYGNGGKMMSEKAGDVDNYDDLVENAIVVSASGTTFGTNDYILFYADGPETWKYNTSLSKFEHQNNIYEDQSYYFLNFDIGTGKRIGNVNHNSQAAAVTVTDFDNYWVSDIDSISESRLGRVWFHKRFNSNNSSSLTQTLTANLYEPIGQAYLETSVAHNSLNNGSFTLTANGVNVGSASLYPIGTYTYYNDDIIASSTINTANAINFAYRYSVSGNGNGYLDYLLLNYKSRLTYNNAQLNFRNLSVANLGTNQYVSYELDNANGATVWDVTNMFLPVNVSSVNSGGKLTFKSEGNLLREFIAFNESTYMSPSFVEKVVNQNLHALGYADLIIIANKNFKTQAEEFAAYKRSQFGQIVQVVDVAQIYNEFSGGSQDITALRNFIKMHYDRAATPDEVPDGVLLYGNASFDFKDRIPNNTNFVPSYQTPVSNRNPEAFTTDDYYGILDDGEDMNNPNALAGSTAAMMDISIGRFPVNTEDEAKVLLDKYKIYHSKESYGDWKNIVSFVADDRDPGGSGMNHLDDCEKANESILNEYKTFNLYKIYADAYRKQQTSSGARFPLVNKAINDQVFNGTLYMSYSGHGSPERWAEEAILASKDYSRWNNLQKLPFIFTGTCDFSRFDNPYINAAGVQLLKRKEGGAIALLSTTQIVYSYANTNFSTRVVNNLFTKNSLGKYETIGEVVRLSKNQSTFSFEIKNNFNYTLLGDPTMYLGIPNLNVKTDKLFNITTGTEVETDTLSALGRYLLEGSIQDDNDNDVTNFNGTVYITIYDKPMNLQTIPSDRNPTPSYKVQNNTLTKVSASVVNGKFSVPFIVPKDILFDYGNGKISYYAHSDQQEANGFDTTRTVGGFDPNAAAEDNDAPIVKAYIDNDKFKNGSIVGENPTLYATFFDENGINISGSSLGHDLVAILDGDESAPFVMNSYYKSAVNDFKNGHLYFPFYNLPEGKHTIKVRAWDVYNNSGEGEVSFEVKNPEKGFIGEIYSYPNPFTESTNIVIQHNQEGKNLTIKVRIYDPSGRLVGFTEKSILADGNATQINWDATTLDGRTLEKGMYFYNVEIITDDGKSANANQKLIYLPH